MARTAYGRARKIAAMTDVGRFMVVAGIGLAAIGAVVWLLGRSGFRWLPGDVAYEGQNVRFYFPIVTSIVISIVLSLVFWLLRR